MIEGKMRSATSTRHKASTIEYIQWNPTAQNENLILTSTMNVNPKI